MNEPLPITWDRTGVTIHDSALAAELTRLAEHGPLATTDVILRAAISAAMSLDAKRIVERDVQLSINNRKLEAKGNK